MTDGIYIGMNGAAARMAQLDAIADNLANAETPGFRATRPQFSSLVPPNANAERGPTPALVVAGKSGVDTRSGDAKVTGRPLDVRIDDGAWLGVTLADGSTAYTRDGRLDLDGDGRLLVNGNPVLGERGAIVVPPGLEVTIGANGAVIAGGSEIDRLAIATFAEAPERLSPTLVRGDAQPAEARVHSGELEGSNARALESTVELVAAQRAYDHAMQAIQTSRRMDERAVEVAKIR